jgi:adaptin ear-binding coat-associated protein 1/2
MKATLGMGFEDRSPAFDFVIALGEGRKALGWEKSSASAAGGRNEEGLKDFSLKEGEKIHIQVGSKGGRRQQPANMGGEREESAALFSIAPPPSAGGAGWGGAGGLEPKMARSETIPSRAPAPSYSAPASGSNSASGKSAQELGFDDGEFGEFQ